MTSAEQVDNPGVITHPLVQQKLTAVRDVRTSSQDFRRLLGEMAMLMAYELTRDHSVEVVEVQTPLGLARGAVLHSDITLVPILRAGLGMADGILQLIPQARVGHLGIYRNETSLWPVVYYNKLSAEVARTEVILIDPMLATGSSEPYEQATRRAAGGLPPPAVPPLGKGGRPPCSPPLREGGRGE